MSHMVSLAPSSGLRRTCYNALTQPSSFYWNWSCEYTIKRLRNACIKPRMSASKAACHMHQVSRVKCQTLIVTRLSSTDRQTDLLKMKWNGCFRVRKLWRTSNCHQSFRVGGRIWNTTRSGLRKWLQQCTLARGYFSALSSFVNTVLGWKKNPFDLLGVQLPTVSDPETCFFLSFGNVIQQTGIQPLIHGYLESYIAWTLLEITHGGSKTWIATLL